MSVQTAVVAFPLMRVTFGADIPWPSSWRLGERVSTPVIYAGLAAGEAQAVLDYDGAAIMSARLEMPRRLYSV